MAAIITPNLQLISTMLHHVDLSKSTCEESAVPAGTSDLQTYLQNLLAEIASKPQSRRYSAASDTTEFARSLLSFTPSTQLPDTSCAEALAQRLLRIELKTDRKYAHLSSVGVGHVKKGSFLQFLFTESGNLGYLAVKVEHHAFLDEADFKRKIGLGETQKVYKACKVNLTGNSTLKDVLVFDTNAKPSVYWWSDLWELVQVRSDEKNTADAIDNVLRTIGPLRRSAPADYTILRNASVAAFKQNGVMDFDHFVTSTFANYVPLDTGLVVQLPSLITKLRNLPQTKKFDGAFTLIPSAVNYRRVDVKVSQDVTISYSEGATNLQDKIWASRTPDGQEVVVVAAQSNAQNFVQKPWS